MTNFNLGAVIKKISDKEKFIAAAAKSVQHQTTLIAETEKVIAACSLVQNVDGKTVDMGQLADDVIGRAGKKINDADKAIFAFFGVTLKNSVTVTKALVSELTKAKQARIDSNEKSRTNLEAKLKKEKELLETITANKSTAESELDSLIEFLPEQISAALHHEAKLIAKVFGYELGLEYSDVLSRVEKAAFKFVRKDGKRVYKGVYRDTLEDIAGMLDAMSALSKVHSGMAVEQREVLFSGFNKLNNGLELFKAGEFPTAQDAPIQAPVGFTSTSLDVKAAPPQEPGFNSLASFFDKVEGSLIVNSSKGVDIVRQLLKTANDNRAFSMFKAVKSYRKNPSAALIGIIDNFDVLLQGYLNVAMLAFIEGEGLSQLDRLFSSPTMVNSGILTPYGRQVKSYIACVLPYVVLKHRGDGADRIYFFEAVKFNRFAKLGISDKPGFYVFGVRSKVDGAGEDATLPLICIRSHFTIVKALRELKKADDRRILEDHAREWHDYRELYGKEYDRRTLQSEIDAISSALSAKTLELAKLG